MCCNPFQMPETHMFNIEGKKLTDYNYNLGTWHIIALDPANGSVSTPSLNFQASDLADHSNRTCQLVDWRAPTNSSGSALPPPWEIEFL